MTPSKVLIGIGVVSLGMSVSASDERNALRETIQFDQACRANAWFGSVGGRNRYIVSLEPVFDASNRAMGWDFTVKSFGQSDNLLVPPGDWHGLQAYNLTAEDLASGIAKSAFGRTRAFKVDGGRINVTLEVQEAGTSRDARGDPRLTLLKVLVSASVKP